MHNTRIFCPWEFNNSNSMIVWSSIFVRHHPIFCRHVEIVPASFASINIPTSLWWPQTLTLSWNVCRRVFYNTRILRTKVQRTTEQNVYCSVAAAPAAAAVKGYGVLFCVKLSPLSPCAVVFPHSSHPCLQSVARLPAGAVFRQQFQFPAARNMRGAASHLLG